MLVHNEQASESRTYRFALWHVLTFFCSAALLLIVGVLLALVYTPLGTYLPISNPELENKYGKELVSLHQRMAGVLQELVELRSYNVKLRKGLGEPVALTDSGVAKVTRPAGRAKESGQRTEEVRQSVNQRSTEQFSWGLPQIPGVSVAERGPSTVSLPAIYPAQGYLTRAFEPEKGHFGLDIAGKTGSPVWACAEGHVVFAGWTNDDGYLEILSHPGGFMTFYKHNQSLLKGANSYVKRGEPIATLGNSGRTSSGPHLHFEIWKDGTPIDPARYVLNPSL